jgi:hypothetical protein
VLVLRFRQPRPPLHHVARLPGSAAAIVLPLAVAMVQCPEFFVEVWRDTSGRAWQFWWAQLWVSVLQPTGLAVAVAWSTLRFSGRWETERGWLDRLGRVIGICWIVIGLLFLAGNWFSYCEQ